MTATHTDRFLSAHNKQIATATVAQYFQTVNQAEFSATAALFTDSSTLIAPFTRPITGRKAIALYLSQEAQGMKLLPEMETIIVNEAETQVTITGKVKTSLFSVNVAWHFSLNPQQQIKTAKIKLLASPQELLGLQQAKSKN